jgi:hypothetical protein
MMSISSRINAWTMGSASAILTLTCTSNDSSSIEPPRAISLDSTDCSRSIRKASIFLAMSAAWARSSPSLRVSSLRSRITHLPLIITSLTSVALLA